MSQSSSIALIGCGFHAKRIYIEYFKSRGITPAVIVDTAANRDAVRSIINDNAWTSTKTYFVNPSDSYDAFSLAEREGIESILRDLAVDKVIISTPPEVHISYAQLCLENGMRVLVDKPLSAPRNISLGNSSELLEDLRGLLQYDTGNNIVVQCQRRRHDGYLFIKKLILDMQNTYGIHPHYIDIYHSDGRWDFPDEIAELKNHPYVTGYGKLLHSGYHFIDLLAFLTEDTEYDQVRVFACKNEISDFKIQLPNNFYEKTFAMRNDYDFTMRDVGELDSYSTMQFTVDDRVMTTASVNLLHTGFSRRAWPVAKPDLYKGNGRVRHERVNIQIGPLMNIQVHSYQSQEVHDKTGLEPRSFGGLEHFDIHVFRNSDLIGGKPYEMVSLDTLEKSDDGLGQNERARYRLVDDFMDDIPANSAISSQVRTNIILASIAQSMYEKNVIATGLSI